MPFHLIHSFCFMSLLLDSTVLSNAKVDYEKVFSILIIIP
ncbi:hypothetical protein SAMN05444355_104199 [Flavobacterium frigoris]|uniref:Uncharacterized protein n=1 Tax=Flavobacterium frigoris TaxID=229204 RepID=A0A1H9J2Z9_FLAFI|nr:hypothetical protein SAMN05444355_104199 [Flavobacterium frigoris]